MTPWTVTRQAPLSMGFSRQKYWRGLPFPSPGYFPNPGIIPGSPALHADFTIWATRDTLEGMKGNGIHGQVSKVAAASFSIVTRGKVEYVSRGISWQRGEECLWTLSSNFFYSFSEMESKDVLWEWDEAGSVGNFRVEEKVWNNHPVERESKCLRETSSYY